jgi:hypothetical protein
MKTIRCKFVVSEVARTEYGSTLKLRPVHSGSEENKGFFKATPQGSFEMQTINDAALEGVAPGQEFYVDLTPAAAARAS